MVSFLCRSVALVAPVILLGACEEQLPFRSLTVSLRIAKAAEDPTPSGAFSAEGPIATGDPDLSCKLKKDARPHASTVECVRASTEEIVSASFSCPDTGLKSESNVGWLIINNPKLKLSYSFSADCTYGK